MPFRSIAKPSREEPYASIALVRICGGFGSEKARFYPDSANTATNSQRDAMAAGPVGLNIL